MLTFGGALEAMNQGERVAREGWNGKGMYVLIMDGYKTTPANKMTREKHGLKKGEAVSIAPYFVMKTATGVLQPGWLASQADMLATDWEVIPRNNI